MQPNITAMREEGLAIAKRYAQERLRSVLGWSDDGPIDITTPTQGNNSVVYILGPQETGERVVLRLFKKTRGYERHLEVLLDAGKVGAPTPRVLHAGGKVMDRLRYGHLAIVTDCVPGESLNRQPVTPDLCRAVARTLAELHQIESKKWGRPSGKGTRGRSYIEDLQRGIDRRIREMASRPSDMTAEKIARIRQGAMDFLDALGTPDRFQLCHHHLGSEDTLYDPETDKATLIDCVNMQYSRAARDVSRIQQDRILGGEEEWHIFFEEYLRHSPDERTEQMEREKPFFDYFCWISRIRHCVLRAPKEQEVVQVATDELRGEYLAQILKATGEAE